MQTAALAAIGKEKYGDLTKSKLDVELNKYSEIEGTEQTNNGIVVTFKSNRAYLVSFDGDVSSYYDITVGNLVVKDGNTILDENCKSVQLGKALTINFDASIANGQIISIAPEISYTTTGEKNKTFLITARTSDGQEITKEYTVNLNGYYNIPSLKVGDFVNYAINTPSSAELSKLNSDIATYSGASDNTTKTATGNTLLCRVLEIDTEGNPTKLISANGVNALKLQGANGYNNAVYLINEICTTLYSGNQGTTKSLTIEDLENNYFSSTAIKTRNEDSSTGSVSYGTTKYYESNSQYPNIASEESQMGIGTQITNGKNLIKTDGLNLSQQVGTYTGIGNAANLPTTNKGITITQTYYKKSISNNFYKNTALMNIFHNSPTSNDYIEPYWIASRGVSAGSRACSFCVFNVQYSYINGDGNNLFISNGGSNENTHALRPIITLNSGIHAEYVDAYNSTYNTFTLY